MLTFTTDDGIATVTIDYSDQSDPDGRQVFEYAFASDGTEIHRGTDLRSGARGVGGDLISGMQSLASFLYAFDEAQRYDGSENRDLFPADMIAWADAYAEEFSATFAETD